MPFDRVVNTLLTSKRDDSRPHVQDDPKRAIGASGMDVAFEGCQTIDRADPLGWSPNRPGLTPPVRNRPNNEYGDVLYAPTTIYPA